jgi:hypothetical protein
MTDAILAALLGAIAAGLFQTVDRILERRRHRETILVAIAAEVDAICRLIKHQGYVEAIRQAADGIRAGTWDGRVYIIDIRSDYFSVFHALSSHIGSLQACQAATIVKFYSYCKSGIDSTRPDGPFAAGDVGHFDAMSNMLSLERLFQAILELGDQIAQFPKRQLPSSALA